MVEDGRGSIYVADMMLDLLCCLRVWLLLRVGLDVGLRVDEELANSDNAHLVMSSSPRSRVSTTNRLDDVGLSTTKVSNKLLTEEVSARQAGKM